MSVATMTDTEFDAYWEEEARNPHRNRIRIGRQYQATIPPKLKSGKANDGYWICLAANRLFLCPGSCMCSQVKGSLTGHSQTTTTTISKCNQLSP